MGSGGDGAWNLVGLLYQSSELVPRTKGTDRVFYIIMAGCERGEGGNFVFVAYRHNVSPKISAKKQRFEKVHIF